MAVQVTVRRARQQDLPVLTQLLTVLFAIEVDFHPDPAKQLRGLQMMLEDEERRCVLVAESDNKIVGMCTAQLVVSTAAGGFSGWIEDVVIFPEYRHQGVGRQLLNAIESWCYGRGAVRVQLLADRENQPALHFYAQTGWQRTQLTALRKSRPV